MIRWTASSPFLELRVSPVLSHTHSLVVAISRMRSALAGRTLLRAVLLAARDGLACALVLGVAGALYPTPNVARALTGAFAAALIGIVALRVVWPLRRLPDRSTTPRRSM